MTYHSEQMTLAVVMNVYHGKVNDVIICENMRAKGTYYTVLRITDHGTVKRFLAMMEEYSQKKDCIIDMFGCEEGFLVVMGYCRARSLMEFYQTGEQSLERAEKISMNLVAECIGSGLPYPLLELVIKERQIHLRQDDSVDIGYMMNLEPLNLSSGEAECANACAKLVRELLTPVSDRSTVSLQLLNKKIPLKSYHSFRELYQDLWAASEKPQRPGILGRVRDWKVSNHEGFFRVLFWISVILMILVLVMALSNIVFGDIPFMRLFFNSFKKIGTESMMQ